MRGSDLGPGHPGDCGFKRLHEGQPLCQAAFSVQADGFLRPAGLLAYRSQLQSGRPGTWLFLTMQARRVAQTLRLEDRRLLG